MALSLEEFNTRHPDAKMVSFVTFSVFACHQTCGKLEVSSFEDVDANFNILVLSVKFLNSFSGVFFSGIWFH